MLPELQSMLDERLLTPDEATEAQAYSASVESWLTMPEPLMRKLFLAAVLMSYDPHQPTEPMH